MKRFIICFLCLSVGVAIGWHLGYSRPLGKVQAEVQEQYRQIREAFKLTDAQVIEYGSKYTDIIGAVKSSDECAAALALGVLQQIERGQIEEAKIYSLSNINYFYKLHRTDTLYSNLTARIEKAAIKYPNIAAKLSELGE